ncbi:DUF167 domain-containing protein [Patescibacteria group bacterium]|nr:DUF167 domain-containing protein [Patescibacteria group bacterium]
MRIYVKVRPNAKRPGVSLVAEGRFLVAVKEPPKEGKANRAVRTALAEYFGIAASHIVMVSGAAARDKIFDIE